MSYEIFKSGPRKGQPKKLVDRVVRYLEEGLHYKEVASKSRYRQFNRPGLDPYFVGSNGAVRFGRSASASQSITDIIHAKMKLWEKANGLSAE